MRRFVLGTAGHVDHGKTTLVRALTGVDTDRLPEEKKRGITIELGFAPWKVDQGMEVSVIDVPGHRKLVHTMIAGAIGMELVLLVVAGDEGVMPQTREHVAACELLGISRAVVAVTKLDRVGEEVAKLAGEEALELLGDRWQAEVVVCSARSGEGVDDLRKAVKRALLALPEPAKSDQARLAVDRVFSVKGAGTVVTGTLAVGKIAAGAELFVAGPNGVVATSARGLHVHDKAATSAVAPTRLAVNLAGLSLEAVRRGDVVTTDKTAAPTRAIDVELAGDMQAKRGRVAQLYVGTARTPARVSILGAEGSRVARLRLHQPIVALGGDRFVLRGSDVEGPSGAVVGGGRVLDARPERRRPRAHRVALLAALAKGDAVEAVKELVAERAPRSLPRAELGTRFIVPTSELLRAADRLVGTKAIVRLSSGALALPSELAKLAERAKKLVADHHKLAPLDRGLAIAALREQIGRTAGADVAEEALRLATEKAQGSKLEPIVIEGDVARLKNFDPSRTDAGVAKAVEIATKAVREAGLKGVTEFAIKEATQASPKDVKAILAKIVRDGVAFHAADLWFSREAFDELVAKVKAHLARSPKLTIAEFKEMSGMGRRQAIVLLEQLDRENVTKREGDDRVRP